MEEKTHLYMLWTNDNLVTADKMVFMYSTNAMLRGWWEKVTLIIWGAPAKLVGENLHIQKKIQEAMEAGVHITACKACADQLGVTKTLEDLGIEVIYWGDPLTKLLKNNEKLITI
ncbi:MAG: DsrE family protein [Pseudomonadota bacterium]